jgi:hypothetical protein
MFIVFLTSTDTDNNQDGTWVKLPLTRMKLRKVYSKLNDLYGNWTVVQMISTYHGVDLEEFEYTNKQNINIYALNTLIKQLEDLSKEEQSTLCELQKDGCNIRLGLKRLDDYKIDMAITKIAELSQKYNIPMETVVKHMAKPKVMYDTFKYSVSGAANSPGC